MLLLSLSGVTKEIVDGAKEAVSNTIDTTKEVFQNSVDTAKNLAGIDTDTDTEEPDSDGETPGDRVGVTTIDADSEPDKVDIGNPEELPSFLQARKEYVFEISEPRLTPTQYIEQNRHEALTAWAVANADSEKYNGIQLAVNYRIISDGEVFDESRRRTQRVDFGLELQLQDDLLGKVRDLERIAQQDYDNVFIESHAVIVTQSENAQP